MCKDQAAVTMQQTFPEGLRMPALFWVQKMQQGLRQEKALPSQGNEQDNQNDGDGCMGETAAERGAGDSVGVTAITNHGVEVSLKRQPLRKQMKNSVQQTLE